MPGAWLGVVLGALDVFVIATGMADVCHAPSIAVLVIVFGLVPGIVLGGLLGWLAEVMAPLPVWLRRCVLIVPPLLLVVLLGGELGKEQFIALASIPTLVAALLLEGATRLSVAPPLPVARARSLS